MSNTKEPLDKLIQDPHAILLQNASIDTSAKLNLPIPNNLQSKGDPGAYIVQARGVISPAFKSMLALAGASVVSYIPNNAYLVRASESVATELEANVLVQSVIPYEPYYKVQESLLGMADQSLPPNIQLNLALFPDDATATIQQIEQSGGLVLSETTSLAGYPVVRVEPPTDWTSIAQLPGVHIVEPVRRRHLANDLARPALGVAADSVTPTNYMNLYGSNIIVAVNDSGIDTNHPDFKGTGSERVFYENPANGVDFEGHGTHVAGIIAGDGTESTTVTNASGSIMPGTNAQFRGKAPFARMLSMNFTDPDIDLQSAAATNNALISNNSWGYDGDFDYDLAAASYDAATRDSLPFQTGAQPVTFVFAAGNDGDSGIPDTITSPGTAKDIITVGALEELRFIQNQVTNADGSVSMPWESETEDPTAVPDFSSCGNVGIGLEGTFGRFKPDVVAPGTFVVSCRSEQWDTNSYYNPIDDITYDFPDLIPPDSLSLAPFNFFVPSNAVEVVIRTETNFMSPPTLPVMPIYLSTNNNPYNLVGSNFVAITPAPGSLGVNWSLETSNTTTVPLVYDLLVDVFYTNDVGNYYQVLQGINDTLGTDPEYYRYETGTSMSAAAISGFLALIEDYFTNQFYQPFTPSPALLKAMTINGSRVTGQYDFQVQNAVNFEGWGQPDLSNSIPVAGLVNVPTPGSVGAPGTSCSTFFREQTISNALATGDSETFNVNLNPDPNAFAQDVPLRITVAWTDPPGDPSAGIKLVNSLEVVVTDLNNTNIVYYGNDIGPGAIYNTAESSTNAPILDGINNVENVFIAPTLDTNYSITIIGNRVNVNAVSEDPSNDVQDFAMVISSGDMGEISNAFTVTDMGIVSNPTGFQNISGATTNTILYNQVAGANTPLINTNFVSLSGNTAGIGTNSQFEVGMTNQWDFYVVTNNTGFTNAAFITFGANTLAIPRMGVFANTEANATTPGADLDMLVTRTSTDPNAANLINLDVNEISNCVNGVNGDGASLVSGGTDFVAYTNATTPGEIFYIAVKSESHQAVQYGFVPIFSQNPFGGSDKSGNQYINGLNVPQNIPDGTPSRPGVAHVFMLDLNSVEIQNVVITNTILHQNFGDLVGSITHSGTTVVLNNHDSLSIPAPPGPYTNIYDDSGQNDTPGSRTSDGPGSLQNFTGTQGQGVWILTEEGTAVAQTGQVQQVQTFLQKHQPLGNGLVVTAVVQPGEWFYDYIDVPPGYTNLQIFGTNVTSSGILSTNVEMYLLEGAPPTFTDFDFEVGLNQGIPPGNEISDGPPLASDVYWVGLFNGAASAQTILLSAQLNGAGLVAQPTLFSATNSTPLLIDAVTNATVYVANSNMIASVNVGVVVQYPRISDLAFTLISPIGQRVLLMENRGGLTATNAGGEFTITNSFGSVTASGTFAPNTNSINVGVNTGKLGIFYNMYTIPDEMTVYYGNDPNNFNSSTLLFDSGLVSGSSNVVVSFGPGTSTYITIIMNQFGNSGSGSDAWTYTLNGNLPDYNFLTFTEDTNLTTVPIKFAIPPFDLRDFGTNYTLSDFDVATNGDYFGQTNIYDPFGGWTVPTNLVVQTITNTFVTNNYNQVSIVSDPSIAFASNTNSSNFLALGYGIIQRTNFLAQNHLVTFSYVYRGPGISGWWRGEGDARDSSDAEFMGQNGSLIGRFNFPAGQVSQAFEMENNGGEYDFAGTNSYVQIRQQPFYGLAGTNSSPDFSSGTVIQESYLDVGTGPGLTVEGWINPTNVSQQMPLVEWLTRVPTNGSDTNLTIIAGPFLDRATSHYYYMLGPTNWTTSETWATQLGGQLATVDSADEQNWIFDTFGGYNGKNRNLWIGLTNSFGGSFGYVGGETNISYTNLLTLDTNNIDGSRQYTMIFGNTNTYPGTWALVDNNGFTARNPLKPNIVYGVVEVTNLQTNGVQFWIAMTNAPNTTNIINTTNGCLFANLMDITNGSHWIFSGPNLVQSNTWQHVALTYDTNSGIANLFYDGTNVASTNFGQVIIPNTTGDVLLGKDMNLETNNYYGGMMDEMSIYGRALSDAEIAAIYTVSATTTNRLIGKFDPTITPPFSLAEAQVVFGNMTNIVIGNNTTWQSGSFTFVAQTNSLPMQITGIQPGMLFDAFNVSQAPLGNLYYQPEQSLDELKGEPANGNWTLEIWNTRNNTLATNATLVNWQLQMVLQTNMLPPVSVGLQEPTTVTVPPGQTISLLVNVPIWATVATNILDSSTLPLNVYFNTNSQPTGTVPPDTFLFGGATTGTTTLFAPPVAAVPPIIFPGQSYYIGLQNPGTTAATAVFEVDFNMTQLTNDVPFNDTLGTTNGAVRYFSFVVSTNDPYEATFQLLRMNGNCDLVVSKGTPLPTLTSSDYGSFNSGRANENIYVLTNSSPVPLSPGTWYLGVFNRDTNAVNYTVLAQELDMPAAVSAAPTVTFIPLTNGVPLDFTAGPGAALTNFFTFVVTNSVTVSNSVLITNYVGSIHFELYNLTGNGDLTVQTNAPPFAPPFFQSSQQPGKLPEFIQIQTNSVLTNLTATWYLGVPNETTNLINFTIVAVIDTNTFFPAFPGAGGAGAGALGASIRNGFTTNNTVYHVTTLNDSGPGTLRDAVSSTNRTVIFDISGIIPLQTPLVITNSYLSILGQTAPKGGVTVAGATTTVSTNVHDVVIRYLRFRPDYLVPPAMTEAGNGTDALQFLTVSNVIADHISAMWSTNNDLTILNSSNVTVQWSIISDSLHLTNGFGSGSVVDTGGGTISLHHNLYADNAYANPRLGGNVSMDFVNNVVYDWGTNAGISEDDPLNAHTNYLNYICNYVIASTNSLTNNVAFWGGETNTWIFQTNNFIDSDTNVALNGADTGWLMFTNLFTETNQFRLPPCSVDEAYMAYEKVLDFAGVSMFAREPAETNIVENVRRQAGSIISTPGILPTNSSTVIFVNSSGDGIPDFWKTTYGQAVTNVYNNFPLDSSGYSELEEFDNWLAGPHAVTVTNTPIGINLQKLFGKTGTLSFSVTNAVQGFVYLTNVLGSYTNSGTYSNSIAIFTPTNNLPFTTNYSGFASFDVYVTNNDTVAYFGPVTVSVFVGATVPTYSQFVGILLPDPVTNTIGANTIQWYQVNVPTNAIAATNTLVWAGAEMNLWYSTNETTVFPYDFELLTAVTNGIGVVTTNAVPGAPQLVPGGIYYLGVQNTNNFATNYAVGLDFLLGGAATTLTNGSPLTNTVPVGGTNYYKITVPPNAIAATNIIISTIGSENLWFNQNMLPGGPGDSELLANVTGIGSATLTLSSAPPLVPGTNYFLAVQNAGGVNATYSIEVDFELVYPPPVFTPIITNLFAVAGTTFTVTNSAIDTNSGSLFYSLTTLPSVSATINTTNGIITWDVPTNEPATNILFTTVVTNSFTDDSATDSFTVTVIPEVSPAGPLTNNIPGGSLDWIAVEVPTNAFNATNILQYATNFPVNILFTTNFPPTTNGAYTLMSNATNGTSVLGLDTVPNIVPGGIYYLGVQNTNAAPVGYAIEVNFGLIFASGPPLAETLPATTVTGTSAQLNGFATPNASPAYAWFDWGASNVYNFSTSQSVISGGNNVLFVTNSISGLNAKQVYHYRLVVSNALGVAYGQDQLLGVGGVAVWGDNSSGVTNVPLGLTNIVAIVAEASDGVALNNMGQISVWGDNSANQKTVPASLTNVASIAAGNGLFALALQNGVVTGWGDDLVGETDVPAGLSNVVEIAAGEYHGLALQNNGTVVAWGPNGSGQTTVPAGLSNVVSIAAGAANSLALLNNHTVVAWGAGTNNTGTSPNFGQSIVPAGLTNVVAITSFGYTSMALKSDGTVVTWGENNWGQTNVPSGLNDVVEIASGLYHFLAVQETGLAVSWGSYVNGETNVPAGLTNIYAVAGGDYFSMALESPLSINLNVTPVTGGVLETNSIAAGAVLYYSVSVPINAIAATNLLTYADQPLNIWFNQTNYPQPANPPDTLLMGGVTAGAGITASAVLTTNNSVPPLLPGQTYILAIQNTNTSTAHFAFYVNFDFTTVGGSTNPVFISSIVHTNIGGTNGFLLEWYAPTNESFEVQETPGLQPVTWFTFSNIVTYTGPITNATNGLFTFFDNGSEYPFTNSMRLYQVLALLPGTNESVTPITGGSPVNNTIAPDSVAYYSVSVPSDAVAASNLLSSTSGPLNIWFNQSALPVPAHPPDTLLLGGAGNGALAVLTNSGAPPLLPGQTYYLAIQNTNSSPVTYTFGVNFALAAAATPTNPVISVVHTNGGFLIEWYAPTNETFQVYKSDSVIPVDWMPFTGTVSYSGPQVSGDGLFTFFDNGSQYAFTSPIRIYEVVPLSSGGSGGSLTLPSQTNYIATVSQLLSVNNGATDSNSGATLIYTLTPFPALIPAPSINNGNGVITWTPASTNAGSEYKFTTIVTDNSVPPLHATNAFTVFVMPAPSLKGAIVTSTNTTLTWTAPTNDQFQVEWTTNINNHPIVWTPFPQVITSTTGNFSFTDTNALAATKFYDLLWLPLP